MFPTLAIETSHLHLASWSKYEDSWVDPLEVEIRDRIRGFIETVAEEERERVLSRERYERRPVLWRPALPVIAMAIATAP